MGIDCTSYAFSDLLTNIVDNRGKTCPTAEDGLPLIATNCVKNDTLYPTFEKVRYVDQETYKSWFRGHPKPGDMIFVCKGAPGSVCWTPDPVTFCIAQDMVAIRADKSIVDPKFLFALLRYPGTQRQILNMHVGTMIPHFKKGDFKNLYLDIPIDMRIQSAIGEIYFEFCRKIELNRRMNETLESMARALFKSWFVDFDPVIDNALAAGNTLTVQNLIDSRVLQIGDGYRAKRVELAENGLPFLRAGNLQEGGFDFSDVEFLCVESCRDAAEKNSQAYDIAFTSKGTVGRITMVTARTQPFVYSPQICWWRVVDRNRLNPHVLYRWMETAEFMHQVAKVKGNTDMADYVSLRDQREMSVNLPSIESQLQIASDLSIIDDKIDSNREQSKTIARLRDTLLPKLLSGELRIPDAEKLVAGSV